MSDQITISVGMLNAIIKSAKDDILKEVLSPDSIEEAYQCRIDILHDEMEEASKVAKDEYSTGYYDAMCLALEIMRGKHE